jgi:hypothetical protein
MRPLEVDAYTNPTIAPIGESPMVQRYFYYKEYDMDITVGARYKHFKGGIYRVQAIATHTETGETLVIYQDMYERTFYARPYDMFASKVDKEKYPDVAQEYRFELIEF